MSVAEEPTEVSVIGDLAGQGRKRLVVGATLRAVATVALVVTLYFVLPLGGGTSVDNVIKLTLGGLALVCNRILAGPADHPIRPPHRSGRRSPCVQCADLRAAFRHDLLCDGSLESDRIRDGSQPY